MTATKERIIRPLDGEGWCWEHGNWDNKVVCDGCGAIDTRCCIVRMCKAFGCDGRVMT